MTLRQTALSAAGLTVAATASHLLRVVAGNAPAETADIELYALALVYAACATVGALLGLAAAAARARAARALVALLLALALELGAIVHGIGGEMVGFAVEEVGVAPLALGLLAIGLAAAVLASRPVAARGLGLAALLVAGSSAAVDVRDAGAIWVARHPDALSVRMASSGEVAGSRTVVHIVLDEMSGQMLAEHPSFAGEAFFERAPAGALYTHAYANSLYTLHAIPQLLSGELRPERAKSQRLLEQLGDAGYQVRIYLGTPPLSCDRAPTPVCRELRGIWRDVVFQDDLPGYLVHQVRRLGMIYAKRIAGERAAALRVPERKDWKELHAHRTSPSLELFRVMLEDLARQDPATPTYYYVHLLLPHQPFVHTADCVVTGDASQLTRAEAPAEAPAYLEQMHCANRLVRQLVDQLVAAQRFDAATLLVQSDHGPRAELFRALRELGPKERVLSPDEVRLAERGTRIVFWFKPAGARERSVVETPVEMREIAGRLRTSLGLEAESPAPEGEISVLAIANHGSSGRGVELFRERGGPRWRSGPLDPSVR
jgi:hypothetical protein